MADQNQKPTNSSRRNFLKIGAGTVVGAAVGAGATYAYFNPVVNNDNSTITGLRSQLATANTNLQSAQSQLASAQGQVSTLTGQMNTLNGQVSTLNGQVTSANSQISTLQGQVSALQGQVTTANTQVTNLQTAVNSTTGLLALNVAESSLVEAVAETIIPSDSNGPGAKEAGVLYFIDRQLAGEYGRSGNMYTKGPFVPAGQTGPITIQGVTYSEGSAPTQQGQSSKYQYGLLLREFWRYGLQALQSYANSAYGGNFETLSAQNKVAVLTDIFNNKPTAFNAILPTDFFYELFFMTWSGFLMDPIYGGNKGMVGWELTAFNGVNQGNFYGEGLTTKQLMVATTPTRLKPVSLAQFQKGSP